MSLNIIFMLINVKGPKANFPPAHLLHSVITLYRHPAWPTPSAGGTQASSFPHSCLHWPSLLSRRPSNVLGPLFLSICKSLSSVTPTAIIASCSSLCSHSCFPFTRVAKVIFKNIYLKIQIKLCLSSSLNLPVGYSDS